MSVHNQFVEFTTLGEVASYVTTRVPSAAVGPDTYVGVENLLQDSAGRLDVEKVPVNAGLTRYLADDVLIGNIRPYLKKAWLADRDGGASGDVLVVRIADAYRDRVLPEFLFYILSSDRFFAYDSQFSRGAGMPRGDKSAVLRYRFPLPPMDFQLQTAKVLGTFKKLEAELHAELKARGRQYAHYRTSLLTFPEGAAHWMTLGGIGDIKMCKRVFKAETTEAGEVPFYKIGTFGGRADAYISRELYDAYRSSYAFPKVGDVLISAAGTIGRVLTYDGDPAYFQDSNIVWIDNDESIVTNAYLRYWYEVVTWSTDASTIQRLYNDNIRRARIAVPPRAEQDRIVEILGKFDALRNDLSIGLPAEIRARRQQYEYYRDKLLTFPEAAA